MAEVQADTVLIGRDAELQRVVAAIRSDEAIAVVGEAGIGKTSLVRAAAAAAGRPLHEGGGFATLAELPYLALRRAVGQVAGDPAQVAAQVERAVGPDVLLVDDLQWTDAPTRDAVGLLLGRISIAVCIRDGDPGSAGALEALVTHGVTVVRLHGLVDGDALELAGRLQPAASPARLRRVVDLAGGNPLVIEELVAGGQTSSSLGRAILGQVEALPEADRDVLELLAVAGRPLLAAALGEAGPRLVTLGLVREAADGLAVRHSLISEAIAEAIDADRRRALHARLAGIVRDPAERARHLAAAGNLRDAFALARDALDATTDPRARADLLALAAETAEADATPWRVSAARQLQAIGRPEAAIALLRGQPIDGPDDLRALGASILAGSLDHEGESDAAWAIVEASRELRPPAGGEGDLAFAVVESVILVNRGELQAGLEVAERAAARADAAGTPRYRLDGHIAAIRLYLAETTDLGPLERALDAAIEAGDGGTAAGRTFDLYYMTLALHGGGPAAALAFDLAARLEELGYHTRAAELRAESAQASILAGDLAGTVVLVDSMLEEPLGLVSRQRLLYNRGLALGLLGRIEDAERTFAEVEAIAVDNFDGLGHVFWCWGEVALWSGQPGRALQLAEASLPFTAFNEAEFVLPTLTQAWAEVELGRAPTAASATAPFRELAGAPPELRGLQALAAGELRAAAAAFDEAAELWETFHVTREHICRWAAGEALRRAGDAEAVARLRGAHDLARAIGFEPLAARARRSLRLAGDRTVAAAPAARGGGILTGREREVLDLVARGLTNAEIARRMSLGRPTVARMLSNAMLKLGAESRAHAIVLAEQLV